MKKRTTIFIPLLMVMALVAIIPSQALAEYGDILGGEGQAHAADNAFAAGEAFQLNIRTPNNNTSFLLPISSNLNGTGSGKYYNWIVDWGDGDSEPYAGLSSEGGGIPHNYANAGDYAISISPNGTTDAWLAAFGFYESTTGANDAANKAMVLGSPSVITPEMTRTADQVNGTASAPSFEWGLTFYACTNLVQAPIFQGWEAISSVGTNFTYGMFYGCSRLTALPAGFTYPQGITTVGNNFAYWTFNNCTSLVSLPANFNLPQNISDAGRNFAAYMFYGCSSLTSLPAGFNLPQSTTTAGDNFAYAMFDNCKSLASIPAGFNLPQSITTANNSFATYLFYGCSNLTSIPEGFNLPQGISAVGDGFASYMFYGCEKLTSLPANFNLPQGITRVGLNFVSYMFYGCSSLGALPSGFNLPQGITSAENYFASNMFNMAGGPNFQINAEFKFPVGVTSTNLNNFYRAFLLAWQAPMQNRSAASIIGDCPVPSTQRNTFDTHFKDLDYIPINWGGKDLTPPDHGEPGTGDLNGDGVVTMDEVIIALRGTVSATELSPSELDILDIDRDRAITMNDVILMLQMTTT
ncbi:MAG: leucine-rich repeat protein [Coriobacteriia bacterium]|nr:leucine-rich repeat protein [Coriobacteriia bacterium]